MGHAFHFLERIERLSMSQADFALALYRDSDLVRFVLASVKLPDGVERVALAVSHEPDTPHVIVERDGRFVTCLGKDMRVGDDVVVVARGRLDKLTAERDEFREAYARVSGGSARQIFRRLYRSGPALPREDIRTLRAIYPLYWPELFQEANALARRLQDFRVRYRRSNYHRLNASAREALRGYWQASWALGHLVGLHGTVVREVATDLASRLSPQEQQGMCMSWLTTRTMSTPLVLRGAWNASRAGQILLTPYRHKLEQATTILSYLDSMVGLMAIGLRHRKLLGEVRKAIARGRNRPLENENNFGAKRMRILLRLYESLLSDDGDKAREAHHAFGTEMLIRLRAACPPEHPIQVEAGSKDELADELTYLLPLLSDNSLLHDMDGQMTLPILIPWVVSVDLEDLYLPANTLSRLHVGAALEPERILAQLDDFAKYANFMAPVRSEDKPGRNDPCSCGSGNKYKRCCGAAA